MALSAHDASSADIRIKRINIELDMLKNLSKDYKFSTFETVLGLYIRFQIDRAAVKSELLDKKISSYVFDVLLDHKYPFQQPQIFCRTNFSTPSINDGRDLFNDILKQEWKIAKKLYEIVQYIPDFISDVKITEEEMKVYGTFHLGFLYEMSNWGQNGVDRASRIFECHEQDENDEETYYLRYLVVTSSAIILLEPQKQMKNMGLLVSWATLQSLDKLRRNLAKPELISFVWKHIPGKQPWVLNVLIPQYDECIGALVTNMQNMGVGVEKNIKNQTKIKESEVTKEAISQMDINQILEHIVVYEDAVNNDLSLSTVQTLTTLYQKSIEYYSAFDDLMYNEFLNRMQSLLQRQDIQIVLNSFDDEKKQQEQIEKQKLQQEQEARRRPQIDFDVGDEEEEVKQVESQNVVVQQDKKRIFQIGSDEDEQQANQQFLEDSEEEEEYEDEEESPQVLVEVSPKAKVEEINNNAIISNNFVDLEELDQLESQPEQEVEQVEPLQVQQEEPVLVEKVVEHIEEAKQEEAQIHDSEQVLAQVEFKEEQVFVVEKKSEVKEDAEEKVDINPSDNTDKDNNEQNE